MREGNFPKIFNGLTNPFILKIKEELLLKIILSFDKECLNDMGTNVAPDHNRIKLRHFVRDFL